MQKTIQKDLRGVKVMLCTPVMDKFTVEYVTSLLKTVQTMLQYGIILTPLFNVGDSLIMRSRNKLVSYFMDSDNDYLMFIDSDIGWEPEAILRLLAFDKDFSGVMYRNRHQHYSRFTTNIKFPVNQCQDTGLVEAKHIATGFMLLKRSVIEKLFKAHPELKLTDDNENDADQHYYRLFDTEQRGNVMWGEDFTFCNRWVETGGSIWIDPKPSLKHVGKTYYAGNFEDALNEAIKKAEN